MSDKLLANLKLCRIAITDLRRAAINLETVGVDDMPDDIMRTADLIEEMADAIEGYLNPKSAKIFQIKDYVKQ